MRLPAGGDLTAARAPIEQIVMAVSVRVGWTRAEVIDLSCRDLMRQFKTLYPIEA